MCISLPHNKLQYRKSTLPTAECKSLPFSDSSTLRCVRHKFCQSAYLALLLCVSLIGGRVDYLICMLIAILTSMAWLFVSYVYRLRGHLYLTDSEFTILIVSLIFTANIAECVLHFFNVDVVCDMFSYVESFCKFNFISLLL